MVGFYISVNQEYFINTLRILGSRKQVQINAQKNSDEPTTSSRAPGFYLMIIANMY